MIKEAMEYLLRLKRDQVVEVDGYKYTPERLQLITEPKPERFGINTLTGLVDYIDENPDDLDLENKILQVEDEHSVYLFSELNKDNQREHYVSAIARLPQISFGRFLDQENFIIMLQAAFMPTEDRETLLKIVGNIRDENVTEFGDDGVTQQVQARTGITRVENIAVPNPVRLKPYRTFLEVEQPESSFVLRMRKGPEIALFEADGGSWKNQAICNIRDFLRRELEEIKINIIA